MFFFDKRYLFNETIFKELDKLKISSVKPFKLASWKNGSGCIYFNGMYLGKKVFVKVCPHAESVKREFLISKDLELEHISPKVIFCRYVRGLNFVVHEMAEASRTLAELDLDLINEKQKVKIATSLIHILNCLSKHKIVHRDLRPENFLILNDYSLKLIDYQFAVSDDRKKYKELKCAKNNSEIIRRLGGEYSRGEYRWDDAYSIWLILKKLGVANIREFEIRHLVGRVELYGIRSSASSKLLWFLRFFYYLNLYRTKITLYRFLDIFKSSKKYSKKILKLEKRRRGLMRDFSS